MVKSSTRPPFRAPRANLHTTTVLVNTDVTTGARHPMATSPSIPARSCTVRHSIEGTAYAMTNARAEDGDCFVKGEPMH